MSSGRSRLIALIQRVSEAAVTVEQRTVGRIGRGILALIGIQRGDDAARAARLLERVLGYRIFEDETGRMNRSLTDIARRPACWCRNSRWRPTPTRARAPDSAARSRPSAARPLFDELRGAGARTSSRGGHAASSARTCRWPW